MSLVSTVVNGKRTGDRFDYNWNRYPQIKTLELWNEMKYNYTL